MNSKLFIFFILYEYFFCIYMLQNYKCYITRILHYFLNYKFCEKNIYNFIQILYLVDDLKQEANNILSMKGNALI